MSAAGALESKTNDVGEGSGAGVGAGAGDPKHELEALRTELQRGCPMVSTMTAAALVARHHVCLKVMLTHPEAGADDNARQAHERRVANAKHEAALLEKVARAMIRNLSPRAAEPGELEAVAALAAMADRNISSRAIRTLLEAFKKAHESTEVMNAVAKAMRCCAAVHSMTDYGSADREQSLLQQLATFVKVAAGETINMGAEWLLGQTDTVAAYVSSHAAKAIPAGSLATEVQGIMKKELGKALTRKVEDATGAVTAVVNGSTDDDESSGNQQATATLAVAWADTFSKWLTPSIHA
mgnify:CR=1 FL=1